MWEHIYLALATSWNIFEGRSSRRKRQLNQWVERDKAKSDGHRDQGLPLAAFWPGHKARASLFSSVLSYIDMVTFHNPQVRHPFQKWP
jgi:hypothetical protein